MMRLLTPLARSLADALADEVSQWAGLEAQSAGRHTWSTGPPPLFTASSPLLRLHPIPLLGM